MIGIMIGAGGVCVLAAVALLCAGELVLGGVALTLGLVISAIGITIELSFERIHRSRPWIF